MSEGKITSATHLLAWLETGGRVEIDGVEYAPGEVWTMPVIRIADAIARGVIVEVRE